MALTRIQRNMIADGAVMPNNLVTTATYTVGGLQTGGTVGATTLSATSQVTTPKITVSGSSGLAVDTLRINTSSWIAYYDPTSKELTYGPITGTTGTLAVYDQSLNTTDRVRFVGVTASTATFNNTVTIGTGLINISTTSGFRVSGIKPALQSNLVMINTATGELTYFAGPNQTVSTSSSPTFANLTVTNVLKAGGNIYPTTSGTNGQILITNGAGTLSFADVPNRFDQELNTTDAVTFDRITVENSVAGNDGGSIEFNSYPGIGLGSITSTRNGTDGELKMAATKVELDGGKRVTLTSADSGGGAYLDVVYSTVRSQRRVDLSINRDGTYSTWSFTATNLTFPDATQQSTAFTGWNQSGTTATFNTVYISTGSLINYSGGLRGGTPSAGGDLYLFAGANGYDGVIRFTANRVESNCSIIPKQNLNVDLGSSTNRWNRSYIKTMFVGNNTIYFQDDNSENTSTFSITSGTVSVDGTNVLDQAVTTGSSPTFSSVDATTSTFEDIIVNSELFFPDNTVQTTAWTGKTDRITSGTYNVIVNSSGTLTLPAAGFQVGGINANGGTITEVDAIIGTTIATPLNISNGGNNWSFESTGTLQFPDGTQQASAWTGTYSYNNLTDKPYIPNQSVDTTSSPTFQNLTVIGTMTTLNVTTENVTTENIVTQNFADGTSQTTAWTGTVANSQITSVSTTKVNGLSVVGWTNNYNDLSNIPQALGTGASPTFTGLTVSGNQVNMAGLDQGSGFDVVAYDTLNGRLRKTVFTNQNLYNTSTVQFAHVSTNGLVVNTGTTVNRTVSAGGFPLNSAGTATVSATLPNYPALLVSNYTSGLTPNISIRAYGQNRPGGIGTTAANPTLFIEGSRGTALSPTAVQAGDPLGGMAVQGYDGANWPNDYNPNSYNYLGFYATESMTAVGTSTYQAGSGFNLFLQPGWTRPGLGATRHRMMFTTWTTSSTAPSILNYIVGSGVDGGTPPTMTMVDGTTYTDLGRTNFTEVNVNHNFIGVPAQDTAPDNASLTATVAINLISGRRSGRSGRRNQIQTGDDLGVISFRGQSTNNSTGVGVRGGVIFANALEAFTSTRYGTSIGIRTVNSGTTVESNRLLMTDREMLHGADSHVFRDKSNSFTAASISTSSVAFNSNAPITTYNRTYGEFCYVGGTIIATATNTVYAFPLDTTNTASGVVIQSGQQIKFNQVGGGFFTIIMSLQTSQTVNSVAGMDFWLRKNGVDVPNSATQVDLLKDQKAVVAMDWLVTPAVNDYYEIVYAVDDTNLEFPFYAAQASPFVRPAVPPIIVNVIPVGA